MIARKVGVVQKEEENMSKYNKTCLEFNLHQEKGTFQFHCM